jgi:hypothetical protein
MSTTVVCFRSPGLGDIAGRRIGSGLSLLSGEVLATGSLEQRLARCQTLKHVRPVEAVCAAWVSCGRW